MPRILLIEDDQAVREGLELALRRQYHEVTATGSGEEGLRMLAGTAPDLVVLDLMLPGIDGFEVCRRVRRESATPIVMLTARDDDFGNSFGLVLLAIAIGWRHWRR